MPQVDITQETKDKITLCGAELALKTGKKYTDKATVAKALDDLYEKLKKEKE